MKKVKTIIGDSVCKECATKMGYKPREKVCGMWQGKCEFCGKDKPLSSLSHDWAKNGKAAKVSTTGIRVVVDLASAKPIWADTKQVYDELVRINRGCAINRKKVVELLFQMHYIMGEYESLRFAVNHAAQSLVSTAKRHLRITRVFYKV